MAPINLSLQGVRAGSSYKSSSAEVDFLREGIEEAAATAAPLLVCLMSFFVVRSSQ